MDKKKISRIALIYSIVSILYYIVFISIILTKTDYCLDSYNITVSRVAFLVVVILKSIALFFVGKRVGLVLGFSTFLTVVYNGYMGGIAGFVIFSVCFVTAIVIAIMLACLKKRFQFNAIVNFILPLMLISILLGYFSLFNPHIVTQSTTTSFVSPSERYIVESYVYWSFDTPVYVDIYVRKNVEIPLVIAKLIPTPVAIRSYEDFEIDEEILDSSIEWIDDTTVKVNGKSIKILDFIDY